MSTLAGRTILYPVPVPGGGEKTETFDLGDGEMALVEAMTSAGLSRDHFWAYMAETYPRHVMAPQWRRDSGTRGGVDVAEFIRAIPSDPRWVEMIQMFYTGRYDGELTEDITPPVMALIMWVKGEDFLSFRNWVEFLAAVQNRPISVAEKLGLPQEGSRL